MLKEERFMYLNLMKITLYMGFGEYLAYHALVLRCQIAFSLLLIKDDKHLLHQNTYKILYKVILLFLASLDNGTFVHKLIIG